MKNERYMHLEKLAKEAMYEIASITSFYARTKVDGRYYTDREVASIVVDRVKEMFYPLTSDPEES
jgi:tRNA(Ser,Leu) C12 N-acetylase TAN1